MSDRVDDSEMALEGATLILWSLSLSCVLSCSTASALSHEDVAIFPRPFSATLLSSLNTYRPRVLLAPSTASDEFAHSLPCDTRWCGWEGKLFAAAAVDRLAAVMSAFTIVILAETLLLHASAGGTLLPAEPRF